MKKIGKWVEVCMVVGSLLLEVGPARSADESQERNLIRNPGFESLGEDGQPTGWSVNPPEALSVDRENAYHGHHSIHFRLDGQQVRCAQAESFPIIPGQVYLLSAMVKTQNFSRTSQYGILLVNDGWTWASPPLEITASDSDWREYRVRFKVPSLSGMSQQARLNLYWDGDQGHVWVDAVRLELDEEAYRTAPVPEAEKESAGDSPALAVTVEAPPAMTTGDLVIATVRVQVPGAVVVDEAQGCFIDRVELHRFEEHTGGEFFQPRARLAVVRNPDQQAPEFTAHFMITSPEPGLQYYGVWAGYRGKWVPFSIEVTPKTVPLGQSATLRITSALTTEIQDSENCLLETELYECNAVARFEQDENTGVRLLTNQRELLEAQAGKIGQARNPEPTGTVFPTQFTVGPETEPRTACYLVRSTLIENRDRWDVVCVRFGEPSR